MTAPLVTAALIGGALVHALVVPHLLTRWAGLRRAPGEALALWQAVSLTGVVCALLAAPVAALTFGAERPRLLAAALVVSGLMVARLLWSGHRIGTDLRRMRRQHREVVDLVGDRLEEPSAPRSPRGVSVVATASPTAYCLPGRRDRIVLSQGAVDRLSRPELTAVLAHERAHLRQRHDLLLELFTVLHEAVPATIRAPGALREVHLLAEMLADRAAVHGRAEGTDHRTLARALVTMALPDPATDARTGLQPAGALHLTGGAHPAGVAAYPQTGGAGAQVTARLRALAAPEAGVRLRSGVLALAAASTVLPWALLALLLG